MFEELHGFDDPATLAVEFKRFASENHGWAGREFVRKLLEAKAKDESALKQFIKDRRAAYLRGAKRKILSASRDLIRLHGKFATIYAAGALAIKYKVLPFTREVLRFAILKCEADHVAYVEKGGEGKPQTAPLDKLRDQLREHSHGLINLADYDEKDRSAWGYLNNYDGGEEVLLKNNRFEKLVGGKQEADRLKLLLAASGFLKTARGNNGKLRYVVRRSIGKTGKHRDWFVAIDMRFLDDQRDGVGGT